METKQCSKCGEEKPTAEFNNRGRKCDACHRSDGNAAAARYRARKKGVFNEETSIRKSKYTKEERIKRNNEASQRRRDRDKERINARNRERYAANPERFRMTQAAWTDKNRDRCNELGRKWYAENRESILARDRAKTKVNKEKRAIQYYLDNKEAVDERRASGTECDVDGCMYAVVSRKLCSAHYSQARKADWSGRWANYPAEVRVRSLCSVDGCESHSVGRGLCSMHRQRELRHGSTKKPVRGSGELCTADGCTSLKIKGQSRCAPCRNAEARRWYSNNIEKGRAASIRWNRENRERALRINAAHRLRIKNDPALLERHRAKQRVASEELRDSYIKVVLGVKNPPQELIELKRVQLKIHRELNRGATK